MAGTIKGITIEIGGDTGPLDKALQGVNKTSRELQTELRAVEKLLKLDPTNTTLLAQKQKLLADSVDNTSDKLKTLKEAEKQAQVQFKDGKISETQYRALQREIITSEQKLKGLEGQGKETNKVLSDDKPAVNLKAIGVAAGVAVAAAGVAMVGMANAVLNNADELQRQADVTGLSAERLQELAYAGSNLGVELDTITGAQAKLTKSMAGATDETKGTGKAFKELGISVVDGNGNLRDAKDVMSEAFTALGKVGNETERDALAMSIFGKSAMEMNPMIKAGGDELNRLSTEAKANGAVMSNEAVAGLDTFGDTMDNIKNSILGAFGEKLAGMLPNIQALIYMLIALPQWIRENSTLLTILGIVIGTITALVIVYNIQQALVTAGLTLWGAIAAGATVVTTALGAAFTLLTSPIGLIIIAIGLLIAAGVLLYKNWDTVKAFLDKTWKWIKETAVKVFDGIIDFFKKWGPLILAILAGPLGLLVLAIIKNWDKIKSSTLSIFGSIGKFVGGITDGIKNGFKGMVNGVISGLNFMIGALNKLKFNVPDWIPIIGGKGFGFNLPKIPSFEIGTRYLPQDMLIQAHRGEMIVPKSENPYANSNGQILNGGFTVKIENFVNNRAQDVQAFAEELEFYRKQKNTGLGGA